MSIYYIRHGTKSLIAALPVHHGEVMEKCCDRHRHQEFLDFPEIIEKHLTSYNAMPADKHLSVNHANREYSAGNDVHINTVEAEFFVLLP